MSWPASRTRSEELLLARISAAAGRERVGKRRATYSASAHTARERAEPPRGIHGLLARTRYLRSAAPKAGRDARLDLYERGMTVAVKDRIHVVRYDTTAVFQEIVPCQDEAGRVATAYTLTDVHGERVVLGGRPERGGAPAWGSEIQRAVAQAQLPRALDALDEGRRLVFGDIWLSGEEIGSGEVAARWPLVRRTEIRNGLVEVVIAGTSHGFACAVSEVPNLFVFWTLVERFRPGSGRP
ncbi:DUF6585 family protein [Streptomyces cinnamoneus]|uniref:DUF6585 family protein n=1 Tax=Streptomyces cinnamoneus TaxID=53446 RepID=UPI001EFEF037|nr:DUF6585 family protein [Streptomyces cinnamoneus]